MTSPHFIPDATHGRPLPRYQSALPRAFREPAVGDYSESWVLDAVCSCGMVWHATARNRKKRRIGEDRADIEAHRRRHHCVWVRSVKFELYNSKIVAAHIVTALLSALDQIA